MINHIALKYQVEVNRLKEEKRDVRLNSLDLLYNLLKNTNYGSLYKTNLKELREIQDFLFESLLPQLLLIQDDPITQIRTKALEFLNFIIENQYLELEDKHFSLIFPTVYNRLNYNLNFFSEPIEEIRLELLKTLIRILKQNKFNINPFVNDFMQILSRIAGDNNPEMKEQLSEFIIWFSKEYIKIKKDFIDSSNNNQSLVGSNNSSLIGLVSQSSKSLILNLGKNTVHQRNKVRKISILALTELLLINNREFGEVQNFYSKLCVDKNHEVRLSAFEGLFRFINGFNIMFLNKFESIIVKNLMTGLSDEKDEISNFCYDEFEKAGEYRKNLEDTIEKEENIEKNNNENAEKNIQTIINRSSNVLNINDISIEERKMISGGSAPMNIKEITEKIIVSSQPKDLSKTVIDSNNINFISSNPGNVKMDVDLS